VPTITAARFRLLAVVLVGGIVGSALRLGVVAVVGDAGPFPIATFVVNVVGCGLVGAVIPVLRRDGVHPLVVPAAVAGLGGAFTTFATFAVEVVTLVELSQVGLAVGYAGGSVAVGLAAVAVGARVGRRLG
jgi:fluoride exporter